MPNHRNVYISLATSMSKTGKFQLTPLVQQKQRREDVSIECSSMFHSNKADFLRRFITMVVTCVHYFALETKEQPKQWIERGESV